MAQDENTETPGLTPKEAKALATLRADYQQLHGVPLATNDVTCVGCEHYRTCEYAWDMYNTHGDCLASK